MGVAGKFVSKGKLEELQSELQCFLASCAIPLLLNLSFNLREDGESYLLINPSSLLPPTFYAFFFSLLRSSLNRF